jgi:cytochrome b561
MQYTNTIKRYGIVAITLHWLIAVIVICMLCVGLYMVTLKAGPFKNDLFGYHKEFGLLVLMLAALRIGWRLANITPGYPEQIPVWQRFLAHSVHWLLYGFLLAMPITGYLVSCAWGHSPSFFGLFVVPPLIAPNESLAHLFGTIHQWLAYSLIVLICGHVGAALEHHFVEGDNILRRMLGISREPK